MEIDVSKATKVSRQKELNMLNKLNGIKQTSKELKALSLQTLSKLINEGYDKAYGKPIVGKWL